MAITIGKVKTVALSYFDDIMAFVNGLVDGYLLSTGEKTKIWIVLIKNIAILFFYFAGAEIPAGLAYSAEGVLGSLVGAMLTTKKLG